ncbi:unnamed protein product [Protopolystoma xenopodis]|uniref:Uncharacterized protein n=1 Tax=Protopolystoma xenopodis TaxID=117903 RepID=A0A3S5AP32_9PLAT|nr:unnamed protein product [Protopolystoma xenopodis]
MCEEEKVAPFTQDEGDYTRLLNTCSRVGKFAAPILESIGLGLGLSILSNSSQYMVPAKVPNHENTGSMDSRVCLTSFLCGLDCMTKYASVAG